MNEKFIAYLWKFKLFNKSLSTIKGQHLTILKPGIQNNNSGPDFLNSLIKIDNTTWAGNVEIHVKASDWFNHGHHNDSAYDNIILHIVYENDREIRRKNGEHIPVLEIKNKFDKKIIEKYNDYIGSMRRIPCENDLSKTDYFTLLSWLERLTIERLKIKADDINLQLQLQKFDFQEVFYQKLARYFGFKANNDAFELLAKSLPLKILGKHNENLLQIEALLFGQAGLLSAQYQDEYAQILLEEYRFLASKYNLKSIDKKLWRFMRMRPANFPTIRLSQFSNLIYRSSALLHKIITESSLKNLRTFFKVNTSEYWENHYRFDIPVKTKRQKSLGNTSIDILLINTIIPFVFTYGSIHNKPELKEKAVDWLENIKAENNNFTRLYKSLGVSIENAMHSQAIVQLKTEYCNRKRCLECAIGHYLLKSTSKY